MAKKKDQVLKVRLSNEERRKVEAAAKAQGISVSEYLRRRATLTNEKGMPRDAQAIAQECWEIMYDVCPTPPGPPSRDSKGEEAMLEMVEKLGSDAPEFVRWSCSKPDAWNAKWAKYFLVHPRIVQWYEETRNPLPPLRTDPLPADFLAWCQERDAMPSEDYLETYADLNGVVQNQELYGPQGSATLQDLKERGKDFYASHADRPRWSRIIAEARRRRLLPPEGYGEFPTSHNYQSKRDRGRKVS